MKLNPKISVFVFIILSAVATILNLLYIANAAGEILIRIGFLAVTCWNIVNLIVTARYVRQNNSGQKTEINIKSAVARTGIGILVVYFITYFITLFM